MLWLGQAETEEIIGIETIEASINIEIDSNIPEEFEIIAVVDDDGIGNGNLDEINEENNSDVITLELSNDALLLSLKAFHKMQTA